MKFSELIGYNMRKILLEKSCAKCGEETMPRPISKKSQFVFVVCQVEGYRKALKLSCRQLAITSYIAFLKNKKRSGSSVLASFYA